MPKGRTAIQARCVPPPRPGYSAATGPKEIVASNKAAVMGILGRATYGIVGLIPFLLIGSIFPLPIQVQQSFQVFLRAVLFLLLLFLALILLLLGFWTLIRRIRFGASVFQMDAVPVGIGGSLAGLVRITRRIFPQGNRGDAIAGMFIAVATLPLPA